MKMTRNPIQRRGKRNVLCSYYNDCLDHAVKKSWEDWDCAKCEHRWDQGSDMELHFTASETVAYYDLPLELYLGLS